LLQGRRGGEKSSPALEEFAEDQGYRLLKQLDVDALREFRQHWKDAALAARKKLERLRAFFRFSVENNWIRSNPALAIKPPLLHSDPTLPLDDEELEKLRVK
jgi:site-specific recombinase XerD